MNKIYVIGAFVTREEILNIVSSEKKAIKLLSENEEFEVIDVINLFNKNNDKLKLNVYAVQYGDIETSFYYLGIDWNKSSPNLTKSDICVLVESECKRFLNLDLKPIMSDFYDDEKEMSFFEVYNARSYK